MHTIEPFYLWRDYYSSENDNAALNYGKVYSEFHFTDKIYNYVIHPQWDSFGSETLFYKQLWTDYEAGTVIIEFIGEWNDLIGNDIMLLKHELIDDLIYNGITNFIFIMENVLNLHIDIDDYYAEWKEEIDGDIYFINTLPHVEDELDQKQMHEMLSYGGVLNEIFWRVQKPQHLLDSIQKKIQEEESEFS